MEGRRKDGTDRKDQADEQWLGTRGGELDRGRCGGVPGEKGLAQLAFFGSRLWRQLRLFGHKTRGHFCRLYSRGSTDVALVHEARRITRPGLDLSVNFAELSER